MSSNSPKRVERDVLEWIKFLFECVYGCLLSLVFISWELLWVFIPPKPKSLAGQHVLVTGAGRGLGREMCLRLVEEGVKISCVDVALDTAQETADLCNSVRAGCATAAYCDIADRTQVAKLAQHLPPVDVLINNAGIVTSANILEDTDQQIENLMRVNVMAQFWTVRAFLPGMISKKRGHIVGVASAASFTAAANIAPYAASKYAVSGMMSSLREEFRQFHPYIKTTTLHPFFITPPASSVHHWDKKSRMADVTASQVADSAIQGIKCDRETVTVPHHLYYLLWILQGLPSQAADYWRDMFYAKICPVRNNNVKAS